MAPGKSDPQEIVAPGESGPWDSENRMQEVDTTNPCHVTTKPEKPENFEIFGESEIEKCENQMFCRPCETKTGHSQSHFSDRHKTTGLGHFSEIGIELIPSLDLVPPRREKRLGTARVTSLRVMLDCGTKRGEGVIPLNKNQCPYGAEPQHKFQTQPMV